jgi:response regulator RpfG family c-di-GMP phosphodiesterase
MPSVQRILKNPVLISGLNMNILDFLTPQRKTIQNAKVLVIDNHRDTLELYAFLLEEYGANIVTALSIQEAMKVVDEFLPDLVICEVRFWGESVDTLLTKIGEMELKTRTYIPAIAITTVIPNPPTQILDLGFDSYLLKPIDLDALVLLLQALLSRSKDAPLLEKTCKLLRVRV